MISLKIKNVGTQNNIYLITPTNRRIRITHAKTASDGLMNKGTGWELEIKDNDWGKKTNQETHLEQPMMISELRMIHSILCT